MGVAPKAHAEEALIMTLGRLRLSVAEARDLAEGALAGIGYRPDEARIIADHVIDAALCGYEYSGLAKILNVPESEHFRSPRRPMTVLRESDVSLALDGGNNVGMLALFHAAQATIKKAAAHGLALVESLVQEQRLTELVGNGEHRVEGRQRLLEDHGDTVAPNVLQGRLIGLQ